MELDHIQILTIFNSGISLIMGFYMLFIRQTTFKNETAYWAAGSLLIGIGLLFKIIIPFDGYFSTVAPSVFVSIGLYLYLAGIWEFKEQKVYKWIIIGIPVLDLIQSIISYHVFQSYRIQGSLHTIFILIYCFLALYEMFKLNSSQKYLKKIFRINAYAFVVFLILSVLALFTIINNPDYNPLIVGEVAVVVHIVSGFVMIALTFGFLTAVNIKLNQELMDQLESRNKFFSIIAHDLRGPVGNIMSFLNLLNDDSDLNAKDRKEYLGILNTLSQSTFHLLQNLLEWTTKSKYLNKYESEKIELNQLISNNVDFYKSSTAIKSIEFKFKNEGDQAYIIGNQNMLQTIIHNLVSNAIKFTFKGGSVSVITKKINDTVQLIVSDTGQGMESETINSLLKFKENKSTRGTDGEAGSGLGLMLCKEFISHNKGTLQIESQLGMGTSFIVEFPSA